MASSYWLTTSPPPPGLTSIFGGVSKAAFEANVIGQQASTAGVSFPSLRISDHTYDCSGAVIGAGAGAGTGNQSSETSTPEPAGFDLSGLGALMLGAVGMRRWRTARKSSE